MQVSKSAFFATNLAVVTTSEFGPRVPILTPAGWTSDFHTGVDWAVPRNTPILAPADCVVVWSGKDTSGAQVVVVRYKDNTGGMFVHMEGSQVGYGVEVPKGGIIGFVGTSGQSTGPHLHYSRLHAVIDNNNNQVWYDRSVFFDPESVEGSTYPDDEVVVVEPPLEEVVITPYDRLEQAIALTEQGAPHRVITPILVELREVFE